jgi:hypothetical protein
MNTSRDLEDNRIVNYGICDTPFISSPKETLSTVIDELVGLSVEETVAAIWSKCQAIYM